tara:strand:+ start:128 stop:322 length:195 start_codon:yes stop_codon:yes gene_type:complete
MNPGDLVKFTREPFDGPSVGGLILESKVQLAWESPEGNVNTHQVYWATHNMTNWVLEKNLEVVA